MTRNKTVLSVFINVNPNCLLTIKVAKYLPISLYILSQTDIATRLGYDFCTRDQLVWDNYFKIYPQQLMKKLFSIVKMQLCLLMRA